MTSRRGLCRIHHTREGIDRRHDRKREVSIADVHWKVCSWMGMPTVGGPFPEPPVP